MDPATAALTAQVAGIGMGGLAARETAGAEQDAAKVNSFIARTRASQADTDARTGLSDELGNMRAVLAANGQDLNVGTFEMFQEVRDIRDRERRVSVGNRNQEARDFNTAARNAGQRKKWALPVTLAKAGPSLFDLYQGA